MPDPVFRAAYHYRTLTRKILNFIPYICNFPPLLFLPNQTLRFHDCLYNQTLCLRHSTTNVFVRKFPVNAQNLKTISKSLLSSFFFKWKEQLRDCRGRVWHTTFSTTLQDIFFGGYDYSYLSLKLFTLNKKILELKKSYDCI